MPPSSSSHYDNNKKSTIIISIPKTHMNFCNINKCKMKYLGWNYSQLRTRIIAIPEFDKQALFYSNINLLGSFPNILKISQAIWWSWISIEPFLDVFLFLVEHLGALKLSLLYVCRFYLYKKLSSCLVLKREFIKSIRS